jgi:hypothetical protein
VVTVAAASPVGAHERTLHDFEPLLLAELIVLRAAVAGNIAKVGFRRPRSPTPDVRLRAEFLSFLARGGGGGAAVRGRRLQIVGACIVGRIDLGDAGVAMSLWFFRCTFGSPPQIDGAHIGGSLSFGDCALPGLRAEACRIDGDLAINSGCAVDGEVRLPRARIGGDLLATGSRLSADLDADGARGIAIDLTRAFVGGSLHLDGGFSAAGQVRLQQAQVDGNLDCSGAAFDAVGDASWGDNATGLLLDRARIGGALVLRDLQVPLQGASLVDARAGELLDDATTWGQHHVLDGFGYTRIGPGAPVDASFRLDWLARQNAAHLAEDFRPDPWRRVIRVLRRMGRNAQARDVAIGLEWHLRDARRIGLGTPAPVRSASRLAHLLYGRLVGFGHRPARLAASMLAVWFVCGALYWAAARQGGFVPWPANAPKFQPFVYSLDVFVPMLDLQQARHWTPADTAADGSLEQAFGAPLLRVLTWLEALCGWAMSVTLFAVATGLAPRDRSR